MKLLRKPTGPSGLVHDITPANAGWTYVGFKLWRLAAGAIDDRAPHPWLQKFSRRDDG